MQGSLVTLLTMIDYGTIIAAVRVITNELAMLIYLAVTGTASDNNFGTGNGHWQFMR